MKINQQPYGTMSDGTAVDLYTLSNDNGLEVAITNYGGIIVSVLAPDRAGNLADVVLGFDNLEAYVRGNPFFGCLVGRYANRIAGAKFILNGVEYTLARTNGENHLHGGVKGFDKVVWQAEMVDTAEQVGLNLSYISVDGEEGYPGALSVRVEYSLDNEDALGISYSATTDKDTILNLTNHTYFNLAGSGDILGHEMTLYADKFTPTDTASIPTGELRPVAGTPFDFRQSRLIGASIDDTTDEQIRFGSGYDHNWVLDHAEGNLTLAAVVREAGSGRRLELYTTQPGVQFYTANYLNGISGKGGAVYDKRSAFCLETQHFPDSPNQPDFPSVVLRPSEVFSETTIFKFLTD